MPEGLGSQHKKKSEIALAKNVTFDICLDAWRFQKLGSRKKCDWDGNKLFPSIKMIKRHWGRLPTYAEGLLGPKNSKITVLEAT